MLNRRSFFGAAAAAPIALPALAKEVASGGQLQTLSVMLDASPFRAAIGEAVSMVGKARSFDFNPSACGYPGRDRYVYRTGYPAIDALRSISGVHKERMEKRLV